jgi:hypothetical protein
VDVALFGSGGVYVIDVAFVEFGDSLKVGYATQPPC